LWIRVLGKKRRPIFAQFSSALLEVVINVQAIKQVKQIASLRLRELNNKGL